MLDKSVKDAIASIDFSEKRIKTKSKIYPIKTDFIQILKTLDINCIDGYRRIYQQAEPSQCQSLWGFVLPKSPYAAYGSIKGFKNTSAVKKDAAPQANQPKITPAKPAKKSSTLQMMNYDEAKKFTRDYISTHGEFKSKAAFEDWVQTVAPKTFPLDVNKTFKAEYPAQRFSLTNFLGHSFARKKKPAAAKKVVVSASEEPRIDAFIPQINNEAKKKIAQDPKAALNALFTKRDKSTADLAYPLTAEEILEEDAPAMNYQEAKKYIENWQEKNHPIESRKEFTDWLNKHRPARFPHNPLTEYTKELSKKGKRFNLLHFLHGK